MKFRIQRYNPDTDAKPYMQDYDVEPGPSDRMLLDALVRIKTIDDTLALRRSCREGVCGSDAMNINGKNGLACITNIVELKEPVVIKPLPGLPIIRDLIVDMTQFFAQYHSVKPYVVNDDPPPAKVNSYSASRLQAVARGFRSNGTRLWNTTCLPSGDHDAVRCRHDLNNAQTSRNEGQQTLGQGTIKGCEQGPCMCS